MVIVQLFCVCVVYCTDCVCETLNWIVYIPYLHTVEYQSYKLMEYQEYWTRLILDA